MRSVTMFLILAPMPIGVFAIVRFLVNEIPIAALDKTAVAFLAALVWLIAHAIIAWEETK
jgi:hypothetical protein